LTEFHGLPTMASRQGRWVLRYDAFFKDLLKAFFAEFLRLFYPDKALRLDLAGTAFLDKETFTDVGKGIRRELDLVAKVARAGVRNK